MSSKSNPVDAVIVGAGLSGLQTALEISRAGYTVLVLEARSRVGGKTLSLDASPQGGKVDLGAAWINDTNQSNMYALAQEFGFDLVKQRVQGDNISRDRSTGELMRRAHGSERTFSEKEGEDLKGFIAALIQEIDHADHERPHQSANAKFLDSMTFSEYAESKSMNGTPAAVKAAASMAAALLGVEADEVSALFIVDYVQSGTGLSNMSSDHEDGGQYLRNRQGNQTFSIRMASKLPPGSIKLSTLVTKIEQTDSLLCAVSTAPGITYYARRVVVSLPTCLLSSIAFNPPLPLSKQALVNATALGYYAKTIFVYARPWWRDAGLSGIMESETGPISFSRDTCVEEDSQYSITCFIVGESGRGWSKWSAAERRRLVIAQFDEHFGEAARRKGISVPEPVNILEKEWTKDGWALGAPSPVMMPGILTSDSGKAIRDCFQRIHFVGTETALVWKGYMEGAVRSGIRGGQEVIDELAKSTSERANM